MLFFAQAAETDKRPHRLLALSLHADVREPLLHQRVSGRAEPQLSWVLPLPHRLCRLRDPHGSLCLCSLSLSLMFFFLSRIYMTF